MCRKPTLFFVVCFLLLVSATASARNYLHFTVSVSDAGDQSQREWAWITMVEMPVTEAQPEIAPFARRHNVTFGHVKLAYVRGAAWREAYSVTRDNGVEYWWHESESDTVNVSGEMTMEGHYNIYINESPPVLREDGSRFDPTGHPYVFALPIRRPGEPEPEMRGSYSVRGVMFNDPNEYVRSRKGTFVQQYDSRLDSLRLESDLIDHRDDFGQKYIKRFAAGRRIKYHVVWSVERSTSRRHPHWKEKTM